MISDILDHLKPQKDLPITPAEKGLTYAQVEPGKIEMREIEKAFTRLFTTQDGQKVLAHLQVLTFQRALGPGVASEQLRYMEGQRSMVATILRLVDRGRKPR
ncbi:MAG: hypothetical protein AB8B83_07215 [Bdellovibrionales bacterium]